MNPITAWWVFIAICLAVGLWVTRKKRNRYVSRSAWNSRQAHDSFWQNDRRGDAQCR